MSSTTERGICKHCGAQLERSYVVLLDQQYPNGWKACGCEGARAEREAERKAEAERMERRRVAELEASWHKAGIPERYVGQFDERAEAMAGAMLDEGTGFYIDGTQGTGKTRLAASIAKEAIAMGLGTRFCVATNLMESMRSRSSEKREETEELCKCRILVLDDLGKEAPTAYACERLFDIVNERYNAMLPIVVTSNYTRGEIAQKLTEGDVGRSIASRLCEMTRRVHIDGKDWRLANG